MLIPKLDCHRPLVHSPSPGLTWPWNANFSHQEAPSTSFYKRYCKQFLDTWSRCFEITLLFTVCYSVIFLLVITPSAFCPSIQLAVIRMETMQSAGLERFSGSQKHVSLELRSSHGPANGGTKVVRPLSSMFIQVSTIRTCPNTAGATQSSIQQQ